MTVSLFLSWQTWGARLFDWKCFEIFFALSLVFIEIPTFWHHCLFPGVKNEHPILSSKNQNFDNTPYIKKLKNSNCQGQVSKQHYHYQSLTQSTRVFRSALGVLVLTKRQVGFGYEIVSLPSFLWLKYARAFDQARARALMTKQKYTRPWKWKEQWINKPFGKAFCTVKYCYESEEKI